MLLCTGCQTDQQKKQTPLPTTTACSEETVGTDDATPIEDISKDETMYVSYTEYENEIDDIMVKKINNAGNHGSEAELRENEDIFRLVWRNEYNSIVDHLLTKCKYDEDRKHLRDMKGSLDLYVKEYKKIAETEILDAYDITPNGGDTSGVTRNSLRGNGTRSRLSLLVGEVYRDASIAMMKNMNDQDDYIIKFDQDKYERAKIILEDSRFKNS